MAFSWSRARRVLLWTLLAGFGVATATAGWLAHSLLADLPDLQTIADYRPPMTSRVLDRNGTIVGEFAVEQVVEQRVGALDEGADDYVVKPVALTELDARLRALVRRRNGHSDNTLRWGDIVFDRARGMITQRDRPLVLSRHEQALLTALLERPGQTVTREQLGSRLYGWDEAPESNSIEVHVHNLRRKIGREAIQTVRGLGYRMAGASE